jgi:hypothetical protein
VKIRQQKKEKAKSFFFFLGSNKNRGLLFLEEKQSAPKDLPA